MDDKNLLSESTEDISKERRIAKFLSGDTVSKIEQYFEKVQRLMSCYRCAIMEVETKFKVLDEQFSLLHERNPIEDIDCRLKSPESIYEKLKRKNLPLEVESIEESLYDVAGIRVICSFVDDIYMLADCLLQQDDVRLIRKKDYIKNPKPNGYRSLHLIIEIPIFLQDEKKYMKAEVQLRTIAMENWANLEHKLRYKKNLSEEIIETTAKELQLCAQMSAQLDERMQKVKNLIFG